MERSIQALLDAGMRMEVIGDTLRVTGPRVLTEPERQFIRVNKTCLVKNIVTRQAENDPPPEPMRLGRPLPPEHTWRFLFCCPFTRRMLEVAAATWSEPLSEQGLRNIAGGYYRFEQREQALQAQLQQWADQNPERMRELTTSSGRDCHGMWAARAPRDQHGALIPFPGDPRSPLDIATGRYIRNPPTFSRNETQEPTGHDRK